MPSCCSICAGCSGPITFRSFPRKRGPRPFSLPSLSQRTPWSCDLGNTERLGPVAFLVPDVLVSLRASKPEFRCEQGDPLPAQLRGQRRRLNLSVEEAAAVEAYAAGRSVCGRTASTGRRRAIGKPSRDSWVASRSGERLLAPSEPLQRQDATIHRSRFVLDGTTAVCQAGVALNTAGATRH
jgi:hypothetical protein